MEKAREKVAELVLGKAIEKVDEYKNKKQWEQLFVNTGEFFLKQVEKGELLIEDISALLSSESMKELAERVDEGSKYALRDKLYAELKRLMLQYEIPAIEANFYIANFIKVIMHELEEVNPEAFQCAYLGEWREKEEATLAEIKKELLHMSKQLRVIQNKKVEIYSLDQIEVDLVRQTAEPSLDLDFFEIDDEIFREMFESRLSDECIYVLGQCKEETIYCLLNELRRIDTGKVVLVVKKEEEWQNLRIANEQNPEMGGKILIPWFGAEQIYAIPNNTNIFVYGEEEYCVGKDAITMRKRKRSTIARKLEAAGMDSNVAYTMVDDTHGLYIPLKKKIIRGQYNLIPNWLSGESDLIIPLLLCGQWTETDGDITVLEDLCGKKYEQIVEELRPYTKGEDPLFIRFKVHGRVIYHLASVENAWDYLDSQVVIGDRRWRKYVDCVLDIVSEPDPIFDYPEEKQLYAEFYPDSKPFWSATLKKGLLRSLVMKAYYKKDAENQRAIDSVVEKILSEIKSKNQWLSIAGYFTVLCEASPNAVSRRLDEEWSNDTGLVGVFKRQEDNGIFSKNYYTHFIWGVEQFLLQKEYVAWAVRWFLKMYDLGIKYAISNSPEETLKRIFCTWLNVTVLTQEEKVYLAKEAFDSNYDVWELIYDELPGRSKNMIGGPSKPRYRIVGEPISVTMGDMWDANREYFSLCLSHMEFNVNRWVKVIEIADHLGKKFIPEIFEKLDYELKYMTDAEIISIKNAIRHEIYRHRYFGSTEWAMDEEELSYFEDSLGRIKTENPVYEYEYLFTNDFDFPLLHPCPYSEDEKREVNEQLKEKEIREGMLRFKEQKLNVGELISLCSKQNYSTLGKYLFEVYCDKCFDVGLFELLISSVDYKEIVKLYVRMAYWMDRACLERAVEIAKKQGVDDEILVDLLLIEPFDANETPLICLEDEEIKLKYWGLGHRPNYVDDNQTCRFMMEEMCKYSDQITLIDTLQRCMKHFSPEEILGIMEKIHVLDPGTDSVISSYSLRNIFEKMQQAFVDSENCKRVAQLELRYRGPLEWAHMKCFKRCLELSPRYYADMVAIVYKKDNGEVLEDESINEQVISSVYSLLNKADFCPAQTGGIVEAEALWKWVDEFKNMLEQQNQGRLFTYLLGRLFSFSPVGEDGYKPYETIRDVIQKYGDESLEREYVVSVFNQRGVFSPTGGVEERNLANRYKKNADAVRVKHPKVAGIYDRLYERYLYDADSERECEEYAGV
ncbi:MAG: hypothetical protein IKB07_08655 [Lachnospiraceae bacterium]|nr:hypothetical protein [Lachnospiraceae bacterium]